MFLIRHSGCLRLQSWFLEASLLCSMWYLQFPMINGQHPVAPLKVTNSTHLLPQSSQLIPITLCHQCVYVQLPGKLSWSHSHLKGTHSVLFMTVNHCHLFIKAQLATYLNQQLIALGCQDTVPAASIFVMKIIPPNDTRWGMVLTI